MVEVNGDGYRLWIPHEFHQDSARDGNIDLHVYLKDGTHFVCTLYTPENLREVLERGRQFGERASGAYTWDPSMIVVRDLSLVTIRAAVEDLIQSGDIEKAMDACDLHPGADDDHL